MTASTEIIVDQRDNVLRVPDQALRYSPGGVAATGGARAPSGGQQSVFVLRDDKPIAVSVTLGLDDGTFTEIVKGDLQPGDRVITAERSGAAGSQPSAAPTPRL